MILESISGTGQIFMTETIPSAHWVEPLLIYSDTRITRKYSVMTTTKETTFWLKSLSDFGIRGIIIDTGFIIDHSIHMLSICYL